MYLKRNHLFNHELHTYLIKNVNKEELDDSTFSVWKLELEKELPMFWESMEEPIKPRNRFSHSS
jgi:hypothetical protein